MRAIAIDRFGGPEVLSACDVDVPSPGTGDVRVQLACAGINYIDVYMRNGAYARSETYRTPLPMVPGLPPLPQVPPLGSLLSPLGGLVAGDMPAAVRRCLEYSHY